MTSTGKRKGAEAANELALIGDDDHARGGCSDDLLAQQRAAAAFDEIEIVVGFVRAIDDEIERREVVELGDRDAERAGLLARALGGGRAGDLQAGADAFGEEIEERFGRAAGPEPELHAVADEIERAGGRGALQGILVGGVVIR